jgi:2-polyprenyl-3-methyl-5-hydroxy-6-metoxy-1,4-benzoquinol methylase
MNQRCELCGTREPARPYWPAEQIVRCPSCGVIFYAGPDRPELYAESYFTGAEYRDYLADERALRANFRRRVAELSRFVPAGAKLLELGCAYGLFLDEARRRWDVCGMDICPEPTAHARQRLGLDVTTGEFLDQPSPAEPFDAICLWDTLEHLTHPVAVIEKASSWLAAGGVLALTTIDAGSGVARLRGRHWRQVHPPTHRWYFSRATLLRAIRQADLEPLAVSYPGVTRSWASMAHGLFGHGRVSRLLTLGGRFDPPVTLNLWDIVQVIARKPK